MQLRDSFLNPANYIRPRSPEPGNYFQERTMRVVVWFMVIAIAFTASIDALWFFITGHVPEYTPAIIFVIFVCPILIHYIRINQLQFAGSILIGVLLIVNSFFLFVDTSQQSSPTAGYVMILIIAALILRSVPVFRLFMIVFLSSAIALTFSKLNSYSNVLLIHWAHTAFYCYLAITALVIGTLRQEFAKQVSDLNSALTLAHLETQRAENANAAKTRLLRSASHELRTPVHVITANIELLLRAVGYDIEAPLPSQTTLHDRATRIFANLNGLQDRINSILEASRLATDAIKMTSRSITSQDVDNMLENLRLLAEKKGLTFTSDRNLFGTTVYQTDPKALESILQNLVSNAIKYTAKGSVRILFSQDEENWIIDVADTGYGLDEEAIKHLFEPMYRSVKTAHLATGTGLGLTNTLSYAKLIGASVTLQSTSPNGSVFRAAFPKEKAIFTRQSDTSVDAPKVQMLDVQEVTQKA